jgi:hypothetical protein
VREKPLHIAVDDAAAPLVVGVGVVLVQIQAVALVKQRLDVLVHVRVRR